MELSEISGNRFGRLVAKELTRINGKPFWICECDCGNLKTTRLSELKSGRCRSCGCFQKELASERMKRCRFGVTHGLSKTPEHNAWCLMKGRCHNKNHPRYMEWGGRGISVCEKWRHNFLAFLNDVGQRPSMLHSIDRIDGKKGYEPGNVRWATKKEQSRNRPGFVWNIKDGDRSYCLTEFSEKHGLNRECVKYRLENGWSMERVILPSNKHAQIPA